MIAASRKVFRLPRQHLEHRLRALKMVQDLVLPAIPSLEVDRPTSVQDAQWMMRLLQRPVRILGIVKNQSGRAEQLVVDGQSDLRREHEQA